MNLWKLILGLLVLVLAVFGAFAVFGLIAWLFQYLFWIGAILVVGVVAYKLLSKPSRPEPALLPAEMELDRTDRLLEEMRRKQLSK